MTTIGPDIEKLIEKELEEANGKFPLFHSPHEGYAVIKEECEELEEAIKKIPDFIEAIWEGVKKDIPANEMKYLYQETCFDYVNPVAAIYEFASHAALEAIQVAAMAKKMMNSFESEKKENENGNQ